MKTVFSKDQAGKPYVMLVPEVAMEQVEMAQFVKDAATRGIEFKKGNLNKQETDVIMLKEVATKEEPKK